MTTRVARRRRVLIISENLPLSRDHRLRKQTEALVDDGWDVTVVCPRDDTSVPGAHILGYRPGPPAASKLGYLREYLWALLVAAVLMARLLARGRIDTAQFSGAPDIYFPLAWVLRLLGTAIVYDQRDPSPETYAARYDTQRGVVYAALVACERLMYSVSDHVIAVNDTLRDKAVASGVPPAQVSVVYNGPHVSTTAASTLTSTPGFATPLVCWHGVMGTQDRLDVALRVVARIVHQLGRDDCCFAFVGDGEMLERSRRMAADLAIDHVVEFPGWLDGPDLLHFVARADVGIEPNLEPFVTPVKLLENMALGVPSVAFDVTETRRVAGEAALLVPPRDEDAFAIAVVELLDDAPRRVALGNAGRRRIATALAWEHQQAVYRHVHRTVHCAAGSHPWIGGPEPFGAVIEGDARE